MANRGMYQSCGLCQEKIQVGANRLQCGARCSRWYHLKCTKLNKEKFKLFNENPTLLWECNLCKSQEEVKEDQADTSIQQTPPARKQVSGTNIKLPNPQGSLSWDEMCELIIDLKKSVDYLSSQYDDLKIATNQIAKLTTEVKKLNEEKAYLKEKVVVLEQRMNNTEQYSRNYNLEFHGIPTEKEEDTYNIVMKVAKLAGANIDRTDIEYCHRITPKQSRKGPVKTPTIIAKFYSRQTKDYIMEKKKSAKSLNTSTLGFKESKPIFINEHLTMENKNLFWIARCTKNNGFKFAWTKNGRIFIRRDEHSPIINITSEKDFPPEAITGAITKLVDAVQKAYLSGQSVQINELPELKLLKKKCEDKNIVVSCTACQGIVTLVECGVLKVVPTLNEFIAALPSVHNYNGIINSISGMLMIDLKSQLTKGRDYHCPFRLQSPLHPFVTLLKHDKNIWFDVLNQMEIICNHSCQEISSNSIRMLRPVFLHILCDPSFSLPPDCRQRTWSLLLVQAVIYEDAKELLCSVVSWLQVHTKEALLSSTTLYFKLAQSAVENKIVPLCVALSPILAASAHHLMRRGHDPRPCLAILSQLLHINQEANSCVLVLLSETIESCPAIYLKDFLEVCLQIIEEKTYNAISAHMLLSVILQWLISPSNLAEDGLNLASKILALVETSTQAHKSTINHLCTNEWFCKIRYTDIRIDFATELCRLSETWQENPRILLNGNWFERIVLAPIEHGKKFRLFLTALFLYHHGYDDIKSRSLQVLLTLIAKSSDLCCRILPVILFALMKEKEAAMQVELLRSLAVMAAQKENIAVVLSTFESLKQEPSLRSIIVDLYLRLWRVEGRCYPYLQTVLLDRTKIEGREGIKVEIAKAAAVKEISFSRPEQYGAELVSLLSQMLNQSVDEPRSVAAMFALQGIAALCRVDVVDMATTWKVLAPKLTREKRINVIISICEYLGVVPSVFGTGPEYEKLVSEAVTRLWSYVVSSSNTRIVIAALKALSNFSLEHLSLKTLPENYRHKLTLPKEYSKTPVDAARKPEDVLPYIPGECWIQLLQKINMDALEAAGDLLICWLEAELKCYRSVYSADKVEPINCSHLPHRSIYRAVADHVRRFEQKPLDDSNRAVVSQCLRIISHSYSKPLPPLNWAFLQTYFSEGQDLRKYCVMLTAKQAFLSASARKCVEVYITSFKPSTQMAQEMFEIFVSLGDLCKGVPPNTLRPLIERSLAVSFEDHNIEEGHSLMLKKLLDCIRLALQRDDIHDANRTLLAMEVEGILVKLPPDHEAFETYLSCTVELPMTHLERMTSPSLWWDITDEKLEQAFSIRSALAQHGDSDTPLVWLNECIDSTASRKQQHGVLLQHLSSVMTKCQGHKANWRWILELLGKIQSVISSPSDSYYLQTIEFLCNVLMLTVIILSGHDCLTARSDAVVMSLESRLILFPQALATMVNYQTEDETPQIMEWLHHMQSCAAVSTSYNEAFRHGLIALRHKAYFQKSATARRFIEQ